MNVTLTELFATIGRYLLTIEVSDVLDIAIMAFALYKVLTLVQTTKAASLLKGLFVFLAALLLSYLFGLNGIYYLLSRMVEVGVLALIILFQPEIRRILEEMGSRRILALFTRTENASVLEQTIEQTVLACSEMSQSRTGALIVFEREILLDDMVRSGTVLDAAVSRAFEKHLLRESAHARRGGHCPPRSGAGGGVHAPPEQERESVPGFRHAAPGGHRHERKLRRGGGHRIGGDRLYFSGYRRNVETAFEAGDPG